MKNNLKVLNKIWKSLKVNELHKNFTFYFKQNPTKTLLILFNLNQIYWKKKQKIIHNFTKKAIYIRVILLTTNNHSNWIRNVLLPKNSID
jgi:hypothetical protein